MKLRIARPCDTAPTGGYCHQCNKPVHDLRFVTEQHALGWAALHGGRLCARLRVDEDGDAIFRPAERTLVPPSPWLAAASALAMVACGAEAHPVQPPVTLPPPREETVVVDAGPTDVDASPAKAACDVPDAGQRYVVVESAGDMIIMPQVHFASASKKVTSDSLPLIETVAAVMKANPQLTRVVIEGHADNTEAGAQKLSEDRAQAVINELTSRGIDAKRLVAKGWGSTRPMSPNNTPVGRQQNRRTEFHVDTPP